MSRVLLPVPAPRGGLSCRSGPGRDQLRATCCRPRRGAVPPGKHAAVTGDASRPSPTTRRVAFPSARPGLPACGAAAQPARSFPSSPFPGRRSVLGAGLSPLGAGLLPSLGPGRSPPHCQHPHSCALGPLSWPRGVSSPARCGLPGTAAPARMPVCLSPVALTEPEACPAGVCSD